MADQRAAIQGTCLEPSIRRRIAAVILDNLGKVVAREQLIEGAIDPRTGRRPENWHQRVLELHIAKGYTILSWCNRGELRIAENLMPTDQRIEIAARHPRPTADTGEKVLSIYDRRHARTESDICCGLRDGDSDPLVGGDGRARPRPSHSSRVARRNRCSRPVQVTDAMVGLQAVRSHAR